MEKEAKNSAPNPENGLYKWLALCVVIIGTFMAVLDSSIVNIALPKMMSVFQVSTDDAKWILIAYTLTLGAIIPLTGYLGDVFGTKNIYIFALITFTIGSFLCGLSWSNSAMVFFRIIQALGGGMIMPVGMSIVFQIMPLEQRGKAMGFWGIAALAAPAIGPTLGGYIIEKMDWRLIFYINVPIGVMGVFLAGMLLQNPERQRGKKLDIIGFLTATIGLVSILYVLGEGSNIDWNKLEYPILTVIGVFCMLLFVVNELTYPGEPLLNLRTFLIRDFTVCQLISCGTTFALMGGTYVIPLFLQNIRGYTAMETGIIMFPAALMTGFVMPIAGNLYDKLGAKKVLLPGLLLLGLASYKLAFINMDFDKHTITLWLMIRGIGLGFSSQVVSAEGMRKIPMRQVSMASALTNTVRQVMSSMSVALMSSMITAHQTIAYARLSEDISPFNPTAYGLYQKLTGLYTMNGYVQADAQGAARYALYGMVYRQAYVEAMDYALGFTLLAIVAVAALVFLLSNREKKTTQESAPPAEIAESSVG